MRKVFKSQLSTITWVDDKLNDNINAQKYLKISIEIKKSLKVPVNKRSIQVKKELYFKLASFYETINSFRIKEIF